MVFKYHLGKTLIMIENNHSDVIIKYEKIDEVDTFKYLEVIQMNGLDKEANEARVRKMELA